MRPHRFFRLLFLSLSLGVLGPVGRAAPPDQPESRKRDATTLKVTRDTWFSNVGSEAEANLGGAARLKLKSNQEMSLIDIGVEPLRGRVVESATLHLRSTGIPILKRVTVGTFGAEWSEGTSPSYSPQKGSSSFNHRRNPDLPWTIPGSDFCHVILGQGGTTWRMADAGKPDAQGWQTIAVDPSIVAARVAGVSEGFFLFDDTGSEWTRTGDAFDMRLFPNRFVFSRDSNASSAPYLTVILGPEDRTPPEAPSACRVEPTDLPAGEARLSWETPSDRGAGTIGFFVTVNGKPLPRYLIPLATRPGERVTLHLRDVGLIPGSDVKVSIVAVDGAGNRSVPSMIAVPISDHIARNLPGSNKTFEKSSHANLPKLGSTPIAILDELDKVVPETGAMIPKQESAYPRANHLWNAGTRRIQLHAAKNEFVGFQIAIEGDPSAVDATLIFDGQGAPAVQVSFGRYQTVGSTKGPLPDPIVPLGKTSPQKHGSLHVEAYVPHDAKAGGHRGTLTLKRGQEVLELEVLLRVWDFTLPDVLSFLPEMNCYGLPGNERDYYRLAHRHRTVLNRVPYGQNGTVHDGCAPKWNGTQLEWSAWDKRFGPLFDGSAFADLPRKGIPIECFYLPMHENWPTPIEPNYNGDYWADRAFTPAYRKDFVEVARQFAEHFHGKRWSETLFLGFLNDKNNFKSRGWSRGASPWLLDEPSNFQDFWALRYFGAAFHEGVHETSGPAKLLFRADISRPEWQRDSLDGLLDYNVVSSAMRQYPRIVADRKQAEGQIVLEYGSANAIEDSNVPPVGWCIDAWTLGADGVVPWQTIGTTESWQQADPLALFYPSTSGGDPIPSIRLKAFRRGQQDVEYLTLLADVTKEPRWAFAQRVREALKLSGERKGSGFTGGEDAGVVQFANLRPQDEWALRVRVGEALSALHPAPRRRIVELRTPPRDPSKLMPREVERNEAKASPTPR